MIHKYVICEGTQSGLGSDMKETTTILQTGKPKRWSNIPLRYYWSFQALDLLLSTLFSRKRRSCTENPLVLFIIPGFLSLIPRTIIQGQARAVQRAWWPTGEFQCCRKTREYRGGNNDSFDARVYHRFFYDDVDDDHYFWKVVENLSFKLRSGWRAVVSTSW